MDRLRDLWITFQNIGKSSSFYPVFLDVIHRQNDEDSRKRKWHLSAVSAIISLRKLGLVMAVKYTEEQLNTVDKSFLIWIVPS